MAYNNVRRDPESFKLPTMKPPSVQKEIQMAVKDYVDSLISERSGPGRGMAVTSNDLMLAARAASIKVNTREMTNTYLKPASRLIADHRPTDLENGRKPIAKKTAAAKTKSVPKKEPHWLTWKTNTPAPSVRIDTPVRPDTAVSRINTPTARINSPEIDILAIADPEPRAHRLHNPIPPPRIATPGAQRTASRAQTPAYRIDTPQHRVNTPAYRVNTPIHRVNTPASMVPSHRDPLADRQVAPVDLVLRPNTPQNPCYMPALKAWITNANDYERDVAYNLMQVLNTGGPVARDRMRPRTAVPGRQMLYGTKRNIPNTAGVRTSVPAHWQQIYHDPRQEQFVVNNMARALERKQPDLALGPVNTEKLHARYTYNTRPPLDVAHRGACFFDSQKPFKGSFTINPEWVSEFRPPARPNMAAKN